MEEPLVSLQVSADDPLLAYVTVGQTEPRKVARSVDVTQSIAGYVGPQILIDLDEHGALLGIELTGS